MKNRLNIIPRIFKFIFKTRNIRNSLTGVLLLIGISTSMLSINILETTYEYSKGDIAREDIMVPRDIHYVNREETDNRKLLAAESVPMVFDRDASVLLEKLKLVGILLNSVIAALQENPPVGEDYTLQLMSLKSSLPQYLQYDDSILIELLKYTNPTQLKKIMYRILIYIYEDDEMGILDRAFEPPENLNNVNIAIRTINSPSPPEEILSTVDKLKALDEINKRLFTICYYIAPNLPRNTLNAITYIIRRNLTPNMRFNPEETKIRINEKMKEVKPVKGTLKKGQAIARKGDTITMEILNKIEILNRHAESSHMSYILGIILIQLVFLSIFGYFLLEYNRILIPDTKSSVIIFSLVLFFMLFTYYVSNTEYAQTNKIILPFLLPIPFVVMMISILYNMYLALLVGGFVVFFTTVISGGDFGIMMAAFSLTILGVYVNANVDKRTDFLRGGLIIGLVNAVVILTVMLMKEMPIELNTTTNYSGIALVSGIVNAILVMGILPLFENVFSISTKFNLLELSDLNAPIFKRMLVKAPGTYNHSLIVSTLAEAACKDINANYMLARVGAFYHDIGKIPDADMYIENSVTDPRAKYLNPVEYSRLIINHVDKGVRIARENDLPGAIIDFIREHHGTTTMTYFYHLALENADMNGDTSFDKSDFQYSGPRPRSRETAVVMLADAIEAASRSIQDPTVPKLEGLVRKIVFNKLNEGELDYSDLSMSEITVIQQSFLRILKGIFHTRIEYPEKKRVEDLEKKITKEAVDAED